MSNFAIFRVAKVKDQGTLQRLAGHHDRTGSPVPNAKLPYVSIPALGNPDLVAGVEKSLPEKMPVWNPEHAAHAPVLALDFVLTASPEHFTVDGTATGKRDMAKTNAFIEAGKKWLQAEFGECVHARIHLDETTPHLQGFIVPNADFKPGARLTAKTLFGRTQLIGFQDRLAEHMAPLNLERGVKGSKATHESIHDYYRRSQTPTPRVTAKPEPVPEASPVERLFGFVGVGADRAKAEAEALRQTERRTDELESIVPSLSAKLTESKAQLEQMTSRAIKAEKSAEARKHLADQVRDIPLRHVMQLMNCKPVDQTLKQWRTPAGVVTFLDDRKFEAPAVPPLTKKISGKGAIDLVMRLEQLTFDQALSWLADKTDDVPMVAAAAAQNLADRSVPIVMKAVREHSGQPFPLPAPVEALKPEASRFLSTLGFAARTIGEMLASGRVFVDQLMHLCMRTDDKAGVEMQSFDGSWRGRRGLPGATTYPGLTKVAVLVETPLDALAVRELESCTGVSVAGLDLATVAGVARYWLGRGCRVMAGYRDDKQGDAAASALRAEVGGIDRIRPPSGRGWIEALEARERSKAESPAPALFRALRPR